MSVATSEFLYVLAGNVSEFKAYQSVVGVRDGKDAVEKLRYLPFGLGLQMIKGVENPQVLPVGTWFKRFDIAEIEENVHNHGGKFLTTFSIDGY